LFDYLNDFVIIYLNNILIYLKKKPAKTLSIYNKGSLTVIKYKVISKRKEIRV
jgi:hypothetical protein